MCGDFKCSRYTLIGLNIGYILVAFILIGVAAAGKSSNLLTSLPVIGGIVACGVFLLFVAIVGILGAIKHHQVMLFFYMMVLFSIFVIQFSVACACLAVGEKEEIQILEKAWNAAGDEARFDAENTFKCCGFKNITINQAQCEKCREITEIKDSVTCTNGTYTSKVHCDDKIQEKVNRAFNASGTVGLLFSFTELVAIYYAHRLRSHLKMQTQIA